MDEYGLVGFERSHDHDKLPGGKVIHWNCGALECRQSGRSREDLLQRHANHVGISAKAGQSNYVLTDPALVDARGDSVDSTADFVARHNRNGRQIGIYAHAPHDVGEIDPARLDAYADLFGAGSAASLTRSTSGGPARVIQICRTTTTPS